MITMIMTSTVAEQAPCGWEPDVEATVAEIVVFGLSEVRDIAVCRLRGGIRYLPCCLHLACRQCTQLCSTAQLPPLCSMLWWVGFSCAPVPG